MAIYRPGERHRYHRILSKRKSKRNVTAVLSLTAMVDMFTVLVIFLLQNYSATGEILYIPKEVTLPKANRVNELMPSLVVTVSPKEILIDRTPIIGFEEVKNSKEWTIPVLRDQVRVLLEKAKADHTAKLQNKIKSVVEQTLGKPEDDPNAWRKITLQADKGIDYLTLKKVMYSIYEAGGGPINFAVAKDEELDNATSQQQTE
jgi:biopolymer transport protein ExbD